MTAVWIGLAVAGWSLAAVLVAVLVGRMVRNRDRQKPKENRMPDDWCEPDGCPSIICGGPHVEVETTLGIECLRPDQEPIGTPLPEGTST